MSSTNLVTALGAGSGIDIKALAQSLVDVERAPRKERIDAKIQKAQARVLGFDAIKQSLLDLKTAFERLNEASDFRSLKIGNSQSSALGVTTSARAAAGTYSIEVTRPAQAQRLVSESFTGPSAALPASASFTLQVGSGDPTDLTLASQTPAGLVTAINSAKLGVTAQLINTGSGYSLVLTGQTGQAQSFTLSTGSDVAATASVSARDASQIVVAAEPATRSVTVSYIDPDTEEAVQLALARGDDGAWRPAAGAALPPTDVDLTVTALRPPVYFSQQQPALDAQFSVNGIAVTRASNTVSDVIDGVTLDLFTATTGAARLDLTRDTSGIKENVKAVVTAYNDLEQALKILGDRNSGVEEFGGALAGDGMLQTVRAQVRALVFAASSTPGSVVKVARDAGVGFDKADVRSNLLKLDEAALESALQGNFDEVVLMFSGEGSSGVVGSGLADQAVLRLGQMLSPVGTVEKQRKAANARIATHQAELEQLEGRMQRLLERYSRQFSVMDGIVGNSNSLRQNLTSTFDGMMAAYKNGR